MAATVDVPPVRAVRLSAVDCLSGGRSLLGDQYWFFVGLVLLGGVLAASGPLGILSGPVLVGTYRACLRRLDGERASLGELGRGFDSFTDSCIVVFAQLGATAVLILPLVAVVSIGALLPEATGDEPGPEVVTVLFMAGALALAIALAVALGFQFALTLIADHGLPAGEAIRIGLAGARANLRGVAHLLVLCVSCLVVGALLGGVGVVFVLPFVFAAVACAHRRIFGAPAREELGAGARESS